MVRKPGFAVIISLVVFLSACSHMMTGKKNSAQNSSVNVKEKGEINLSVQKFVLDNGLTLLVYENHKLPLFSYHTFFDVGGRHESRQEGTTGATHFLEHMMFKGAKKFGPGIFDTTIEKNGGNNNAYTSFDSTVYHENLPSRTKGGDKLVDLIIDLEADRMGNLLLEKNSFEKERQVVLEERKMRYENSPGGKLWLTSMQSMFVGTPYGGSVIGDVKDLKSLNRDQVMDFFNKFYRPDNAVVVVAGDVDADHVYSEVKKRYGHMQSSSAHIKKYVKERNNPRLYTHRARYRTEKHLHASNPVPMFMMTFPGYKIGEREGFTLDVLASIIGRGESSYLQQKLVKGKRATLTSVTSSHYSLRYNGMMYIYGNIAKKVGLKTTKSRLLKALKKSCGKAINERSLQKTKNNILKGYFAQVQTNNGVAGFLGNLEHFYGDYKFYKNEMDIYKSITVSEVNNLCRKLFNGEKYIYTTVWNKNKK